MEEFLQSEKSVLGGSVLLKTGHISLGDAIAALKEGLRVFEDDMVSHREYIALKTVDNQVVPWAPSISDALAED